MTSITKPTIGASTGTWGQTLNDALDALAAADNDLQPKLTAGTTAGDLLAWDGDSYEPVTPTDVTATDVPFTPTGGIAATNVQTALAEVDTEKANLASPTFTGTPAAPTAATTTSTTQVATTAFVQQELGTRKGQVGFFYASTVATGTGSFRIYNRSGRTRTLSEVHVALGTAGTVTVDVNKNGTTIFTTQSGRPATSSSNAASSATPDVTAWANGEYLTCDVDVASSGADMVVEVIYG